MNLVPERIISVQANGCDDHLRRPCASWGENMDIAALAFGLVASNAVCDFALQSDAMAKGKNRHNRTTPPPGAKYQPSWTHWLTAHAMIHGAGVYVVTGQWRLGLAEAACHWLIDYNKCENRIGMNTDQGLHLLCKVVWLALALTAFKT